MLGISPCAHCAVVPSIHNYYIYEQIFKGERRVHGALGAGPADLYLGLSWVLLRTSTASCSWIALSLSPSNSSLTRDEVYTLICDNNKPR